MHSSDDDCATDEELRGQTAPAESASSVRALDTLPADALRRQYRADGVLYAYRDEGEHVVVHRCDGAVQWHTRVSAEWAPATPGASRWTVPDNWSLLPSAAGCDVGKRVYWVPEQEQYVQVALPRAAAIRDAQIDVLRVGALGVEFVGQLDRQAAVEWLRSASDGVETELRAAMHALIDRWDRFAAQYRDGVRR